MVLIQLRSMEYMLDKLAQLEHEQWMEWSKTISEKEKLSPDRVERWRTFWIPYADLPENIKEMDKSWARRALAIFIEGGVVSDNKQETYRLNTKLNTKGKKYYEWTVRADTIAQMKDRNKELMLYISDMEKIDAMRPVEKKEEKDEETDGDIPDRDN
jgi:hypothetical protein